VIASDRNRATAKRRRSRGGLLYTPAGAEPVPLLLGYEIDDVVHVERERSLARGRRVADGARVLIIATPEPASRAALARIDREHELLHLLADAPRNRPLALLEAPRARALVVRDPGAAPLLRPPSAPLHGDPPPLAEALALALQILPPLALLHRHGLVHGALTPAAIFTSPNGQVTLLGSVGAARPRGADDPPVSELIYCAPEATGRLDRSVDHRGDLYALGVLYFELFTGRRPFLADDPSRLLHDIIARPPPAPRALCPSLPAALDLLIQRLLAKAPEDRYQSVSALAADLAQIAAKPADPAQGHLHLGAADAPPDLVLPTRLYGQDENVDAALAAHGRCRGGGRELHIFYGPPGGGKSALLRWITRARRGAGARLELHLRPGDAPPLGPLIAAIRRRLAEIIEAHGPDPTPWRRDLQAALGERSGLLAELLPELRVLLGPQPQPPELPPAEDAERLRGALEALLRALLRGDDPLVLVLDDLHHLDVDTAAQLARHLSDPGIRSLLVLAAAEGPLTGAALRLRAELVAGGLLLHEHTIRPLAQDDCAALLRDLGLTPLRPLAEHLHASSSGRPHLLHLQLLGLHQRGLITRQGGAWSCAWRGDPSTPTDLDDALTARLSPLSPALLDRLLAVAYLGERAPLALIARLLNLTPRQTAESLAEACARGLIALVDDAPELTYSFIDEPLRRRLLDRPDPRRPERHRRLAELLSDARAADDDRLYQLLAHLLASDPAAAERLRIADLSLRAGRSALRLGAVFAAERALTRGLASLPADAWQGHHQLTLGLHLAAAEAAHRRGDRGAAAALFDSALARAPSELARAELLATRLDHELAQRDPDAALAVGRRALAHLGLRLPERGTKTALALALARLRWRRRGAEPSAFLARSESLEPREHLLQRVLLALVLPAASLDPRLAGLILLALADHSLSRGVTEISPIGVLGLGLVRGALDDDPAAVHAAAEAATALHQRLPSAWIEPKLEHLIAAYVLPWSNPLSDAVARLERALERASLGGHALDAGHIAAQLAPLALLAGDPLPRVAERTSELSALLERLGDDDAAAVARAAEHLARALRGHPLGLAGEGDPPSLLHGLLDDTTEDEAVDAAARRPYGLAAALLPLYKAIVLYHTGLHEEVIHQLARPLPLVHQLQPYTLDRHFFAALSLAALAAAAPPAERRRHRRALDEHADRLHAAARRAPDNFRARALIIDALRADLDDHRAKILPALNMALEAAKASGDHHRLAIAAEQAARIARHDGLSFLAEHYRELASGAYESLGAGLLAARFHERPRVVTTTDTMPSETSQFIAVAGGVAKSLDIGAVIKATRAIAGEIVLDRLLRALMRILMENAGARRAALLLDGERGLTLEAEARVDPERIEVLLQRPLDDDAPLPRAIISFVARARAPLVLDDAAARGAFTKDPYVERHQLRSVLCLPIIHHGRLTGVLYLENELAPAVFTADRGELLNQLAAQVAISVENARLYRTLAAARDQAITSDQAKTRFLMNMSHELRTPLNAILGYAELIDEELAAGSADTFMEDMASIRAAAHRLGRTLTSILELSRIEAGTLNLDDTLVELSGLIREVADELAPAFAERGNTLHLALDPELPLLRGDPQRLRYCVLALLDNASRFSERARVDLTLRRVDDGGGARLDLTVRDRGIGIAPEHMGRLFQAFSQADDSTTRTYEGSGVSLAVVQTIAQRMGGQIAVESALGGGATFTLSLPLAPAQPQPAVAL
jgi:signal transduction histidine kinase/predicted ATPase